MVAKSCLGAEIWLNKDVCKKLCHLEQILSLIWLENKDEIIKLDFGQKLGIFFRFWRKKLAFQLLKQILAYKWRET